MRLAWLFLLAALEAHGAWLKVTSPSFELYSNSNERLARLVTERAEQLRQIFLDANSGGAPLPVRIYLFASERDYRPFRLSKSTSGYYQSGPERDFIAVLASGDDTTRIVSHEYVHVVLHHSSARIPRWFEEGMAEFYSTLQPQGERMIIGRVIPQHLATLARLPWLDVAQMNEFSREADDMTGIFYAQSWALVHMLNLSPRWRDGLPKFATLMAEATPAQEAFDKAFGRSLKTAIDDLRLYLQDRRLPVVATASKPADSFTAVANQVPESHADIVRAELLLAINRENDAEKLYQKLERAGESNVQVATGLGLLALSRRDYDGARRHLRRAIDMGAADGRTFFEYAMLLRETQTGRDEVFRWLRRTIEVSPNFAEAHALLANAAQREGRLTDAIEHLRRATSILPRQSQFWQALALAYHQSGDRELSQRCAWRALDAAVSDAERDAAQAAVALTGAPARVSQSPKPPVTTPESWQNRQGDARLEGQLVEVECRGESARFHIVAEGKRHVLDVLRPGQVPIGSSTGARRELSCGRQQSATVTVDFIAATREVVAVVFR